MKRPLVTSSPLPAFAFSSAPFEAASKYIAQAAIRDVHPGKYYHLRSVSASDGRPVSTFTFWIANTPFKEDKINIRIINDDGENIDDPLTQCVLCGHEGTILNDWSELTHGFNGIRNGDPDCVDMVECGNCGQVVGGD